MWFIIAALLGIGSFFVYNHKRPSDEAAASSKVDSKASEEELSVSYQPHLDVAAGIGEYSYNDLTCIDSYPDKFQPRTMSFNSVDELLHKIDPYFDFNVATQELKPRVNKNGDTAKVVILDDRGPDSAGRCFDGPPQGAIDYVNEFGQQRTSFPRWVFDKWAYVFAYVFFNHKMVSIPPAVWTNAAHKNGVISLGTIIFENNTNHQLNQMVHDEGEIISKRLVEIARQYGFDGYFINFETSGNIDVDKTYAFLERLKLAGLYIQWYDSFTVEGYRNYQNALNDQNKPFFDKSSSIFTNYWWGREHVLTSEQTAGDRAMDVFMGIDGYARSWIKAEKEVKLMNFPGEVVSAMKMIFNDASKLLRTSVGIFAPDWTFFNADPNNLLEDYLKKSAQMWLNDGVASMIPANSPVTELPFLTHFNTGQGYKYYRFGKKISESNWNHLSQQDVPLTFMYDSSRETKGMYAKESYLNSYHGGSSLAIYGATAQRQNIDLFTTALPLKQMTRLSLVVAAGEQARNADVHIILEIDGKYGVDFFVAIPSHNGMVHTGEDLNWEERFFNIPFKDATITKISLQVTPKPGELPPARDTDALMYIGELKIAELDNLAVDAPCIEKIQFDSHTRRLEWSKPNSVFGCEYYEVFGKVQSGAKEYLGRAYTNHYAYGVNLINNDKTSSLDFNNFEVVCVNKYGNRTHSN